MRKAKKGEDTQRLRATSICFLIEKRAKQTLSIIISLLICFDNTFDAIFNNHCKKQRVILLNNKAIIFECRCVPKQSIKNRKKSVKKSDKNTGICVDICDFRCII